MFLMLRRRAQPAVSKHARRFCESEYQPAATESVLPHPPPKRWAREGILAN
jgi:hypothetical protein